MKPLSNQLSIQGGRPFIRTAYQVTATLGGTDVEASVKRARVTVLDWLESKTGRLPEKARTLEDFELDQPVGRCSGVRIMGDADIWAIRLDDVDQSVPGRIWSTEVVIATEESGVAHFGTKLTVSTRDESQQYAKSIPRFVRSLIENPGIIAYDQKLIEHPVFVDSPEKLDSLVWLIENQRRTRPIYVITLNDNTNDVEEAILDCDKLARQCATLAHVYVVQAPLTFLLTDALGKEFSVFGGAVRTYKPEFDRYQDTPQKHPLAMPERVTRWGDSGSEDFLRFLTNQAFLSCLDGSDLDEEMPRFSTIRSIATQQKLQLAGATVDKEFQLEIFRTENQNLTEQVEEWRDLALSEEQLRKQADAEIEDTRSEQYRLRTRIHDLEDRISTITGKSPDEDLVIPQEYESLRAWVDTNLAGRVITTGRAIRAAKNAEYEDPELAYKALLLLGSDYRSMRSGQIDRTEFDRRCRDLGLECTQTFSGPGAGEQDDEYYMMWEGQKRQLDLHLKNGGNTRDPRRCFRLYFFWDDNTQQVIVGSLPGHLRSRAT